MQRSRKRQAASFSPRRSAFLRACGSRWRLRSRMARRRHLHQLVVLDIGDRLLEAHPARRDQQHGLVLAGGADVGELLFLDRVHVQVVVAAVLARGSCPRRPCRPDRRTACRAPGGSTARTAPPRRRAFEISDAVAAALDRSLPRAVAREHAVHDAGAARVGQELAVIADQAAARHAEDRAAPCRRRTAACPAARPCGG